MYCQIFYRKLGQTSIIFNIIKYISRSLTTVKLLEESVSIIQRKHSYVLQNWSTVPYSKGAIINWSRRSKVMKRETNPKETSIILFPGQGSQFIGMGANLIKIPQVLDMFDLASELLKYNLLEFCLRGPKNDLEKTIYAQPAIFVTSLACLERLKEEHPNAIDSCVATAGFSLGELTALVFAGVISFDQGVRLVQIRAEAMQKASNMYDGGMATVLYEPDSKLEWAVKAAKEWCIEKGVQNPECIVANYLYPHCKIVAGSKDALTFIEKNARNFNLRRVKRLPVNGAFHTNLMESAVDPFKKALNRIQLDEPAIVVYSNVSGLPYRCSEHVRKQLPKQIIKPVKWEQLLHTLYERSVGNCFPKTFECGPGRALRTILKQVNAKAWNTSFNVHP